jgi:hypothetical protein
MASAAAGSWWGTRFAACCSPFAPVFEERTPIAGRSGAGGCHCGQVRFECTTDLAMVTACNCSICTKKGLHFTFVAPTLAEFG